MALRTKKSGMAGLAQAVREQPLGVGALLVAQLVQQRGADHPQVLVRDPLVHVGGEAGVGGDEGADHVRGEQIDRVPPGGRW